MITTIMRDVQGDLGMKHQILNIKKEGKARQKSLRSGYITPDPKLYQREEYEVEKEILRVCVCVCVT